MPADPKNYELAYLLSPSVSEEEVLTYAGKLTTLITDSHGAIRRVEEPRKKRLAYPVRKEQNAYFGRTTFSIASEHIANFKKKLKATEGLLRYLLVEEEIETRPQIVRPPLQRPAPLRPRPIPRVEEKPEEKLDLEALDRKLEEILGK